MILSTGRLLHKGYIIFLLGGLYSCGPLNRNVYRSNPANLPGLTQKGESTVNVSLGGNLELHDGGGLSGVDVQAAYALTHRITLMGQYESRTGISTGYNSVYPGLIYIGPYPPYDTPSGVTLRYRSNTWEGAMGYLVPMRRHAYFSISGGVGGGYFHIKDQGSFQDTAYNASFDNRVIQWYIQPAFFYKWTWFEFGIGIRYSFTDYVTVITNYTAEQQEDFNVAGLQKKVICMGQPFYVARFSPGTHLIQIQLQFSFNAGNAINGSIDYNYYGFNESIGLTLCPTELLSRLKGH
jgi:hypothetical protein